MQWFLTGKGRYDIIDYRLFTYFLYMSFTEAQQFSDFEAASNTWTAEKAADGTEVGTPDSQKLDSTEKKEEKNEKPKITPEAYKEKKDVAMQKVENAVKENPKLLSVKEQWPEAIAQANLEPVSYTHLYIFFAWKRW